MYLEMPNQGQELKISISYKLYMLRISYRLCIVTMFDCIWSLLNKKIKKK